MLSAIGELEQRFRKSGQQQLLVETLLIRFALLDRTVAIEDVLRSLGDGGGSGRPRAPAETRSSNPPLQRPTGRSGAPDDTPRRAASDTPQPADKPVPRPPVARDSATVEAPARRPTPTASDAMPTINVVTERWDDVIAAVRTNKMMLASFLEAAFPAAMSVGGLLTIRAEDVPSADALEPAKNDLLAIVKTVFPAVERLAITRPEGAAPAAPRRVTEEEIRTQRMASLRKRDPVLGAAIDALDLELLD
jgi:DNA polymerase-3 subunit gamma/tau